MGHYVQLKEREGLKWGEMGRYVQIKERGGMYFLGGEGGRYFYLSFLFILLF
jgi:hypothetical protein